MRLDVSDLFNHLFEVAGFARARFDLTQQIRDGRFSTPWDEFCTHLSSELFLPACAERAYTLLHSDLTPDQVGTRIFTEVTTRYGEQTFYLRYHSPHFTHGQCEFLAASADDHTASAFSLRECPLTLWLGRIPPAERTNQPPEYPGDLEAPISHFVQQGVGAFGDPFTTYFELHGDWCLRQIVQDDGQFFRSKLHGRYVQLRNLTPIPQRVFDTMWSASVDRITPESRT